MENLTNNKIGTEILGTVSNKGHYVFDLKRGRYYNVVLESYIPVGSMKRQFGTEWKHVNTLIPYSWIINDMYEPSGFFNKNDMVYYNIYKYRSGDDNSNKKDITFQSKIREIQERN